MQLQTISPESTFPNEYSDVIFIQIDQHLKKVIAKIQRGPNFMKHGVFLSVSLLYYCILFCFSLLFLWVWSDTNKDWVISDLFIYCIMISDKTDK